MLRLIVFGASTYLAGLAITVQLAIYPLFSEIPSSVFIRYHGIYQRAITFAVGPTWIVQVVTSVMYLVTASSMWQSWVESCAAFIAVIVTGLCAVPNHQKLSQQGYSSDKQQRILIANFARVVCWLLCAAVTV